MKKGLLIAGGALILVVLVLIWVYLLFFGTPKDTGEVFANLGFTGGKERAEIPVDTTPEPEPLPEVLPPLKPLRQLTLRPVAGMYVPHETNPKYIRIVERGTGHIYEVEVTTGTETQVTKLTMPQTVAATFSPDGTAVLATSYVDDTKSSTALVLATSTGVTEVLDVIPLPPGADSLSFENDQTILYTLSDNSGTMGYRYRLDSKTQTQIFKVPLSQVHMVWGNGLDAIYLYPRPSQYLEGYTYKVSNSMLHRLGKGARGLTYTRNNEIELRTTADLSQFTSELTWQGTYAGTPVPFLPEKCTFHDSDSKQLWCGASMEDTPPSFMEQWYKGQVISDDGLWSVDAETGTIELEADLGTMAGRVIDIESISTSSGGFYVFFINKLDGAVWVYDLFTATGIDTRN